MVSTSSTSLFIFLSDSRCWYHLHNLLHATVFPRWNLYRIREIFRAANSLYTDAMKPRDSIMKSIDRSILTFVVSSLNHWRLTRALFRWLCQFTARWILTHDFMESLCLNIAMFHGWLVTWRIYWVLRKER